MTRNLVSSSSPRTRNYRWHVSLWCNFYSSGIFHRAEIFPRNCSPVKTHFCSSSFHKKRFFHPKWQQEVNFILRHVSRFPRNFPRMIIIYPGKSFIYHFHTSLLKFSQNIFTHSYHINRRILFFEFFPSRNVSSSLKRRKKKEAC